MTKDDKRHYWIVTMDSYDVDWDKLTVRELRDTFMRGLEKNIKYISVINQAGEDMFRTEGHSTETLNGESWIEEFDEEGNLDIEETANSITKDFLDNRAIIAMRFDKDMYDELGKDKDWIHKILEDD
jgi:hypothetical protein